MGSDWVSVPLVIAADICLWPYSVDVLSNWLLFFIGPLTVVIWGLAVSPMLIFLFFMNSGLVGGFSLRKLFLDVRGLIVQFQCRLFLLVQALIFGDLVGFLVLCCVRYVFCLVVWAGFFLGSNHSRLRHIGWVQSGHGLTSRPRETSDVRFLDELLFLFGYPPVSGCALLRGTLPLRYCTSRFAHKLPDSGSVAMLVHSGYGNGLLVRSDPSSSDPGRISDGFGVLRSGRKRVRLRRKNPVHEVFRAPFGDHSRPRVWKRLNLGVSFGEDDDAGRRQLHDHLGSGGPVHDRTGIG